MSNLESVLIKILAAALVYGFVYVFKKDDTNYKKRRKKKVSKEISTKKGNQQQNGIL